MVLAPEHPLVDVITANEWPGDVIETDWASAALDAWKGLFGATGTPADAVARYREFAGAKSELERQAEGREKTGVFIGAFAINPTNAQRIPIFIADYVLMGYGTGAIMAVPAHDHRDFEFAREFELPIVPVIRPSDEWLAEHGASADDTGTWPEAYVGDGVAMNSANAEVSLDGLSRRRRQARDRRVARGAATRASRPSPTSCATGCSAGSATGVSRSRSSTTTSGRSRCPDVAAAGRAARDHQLRARDLRRSRRAAAAAARARRGLGGGRARPPGRGVGGLRRRAARVPPRDQHDAAVGGIVLVLPALPRSHQRGRAGRSRGRAGVGAGRARRRLAEGRARRPLRRRGRARGAAPALRALLAQGALRPRPRVDGRAVPASRQPGHGPRRGVHRRARRCTSRRRRWRSATARSSSRARRSSASSARWARA